MTGNSSAAAVAAGQQQISDQLRLVAVGMRPAQWIKNGLLFAGLIVGSKLFDIIAITHALFAFAIFCLLCGGFYLINDVRDARADRLHPLKRQRPVAAGLMSPLFALQFGIGGIIVAL